MKNNNTYRVLGIMSGTSLDGLDIALCKFSLEGDKWNYSIEESITLNYPNEILNRLSKSTKMSGLELKILEVDFSRFVGDQIGLLAKDKQIDFISSHGHTVFHQPEFGLTYQIGDGNIIHEITGLPVVYDFRTLDVARGGQGAPLVPLADQLLFGEYDYCINLGGIANISYDEEGQRLAYDIAPCNLLLNKLASRVGKDYDENGDLASAGIIKYQLLNKWNAFDYYSQSGAKSLGYEWVDKMFFEDIAVGKVEDLAATVVEHIAFQISNCCEKALKSSQMLVTGGGTKNIFLINQLKNHLEGIVDVIVPEEKIIDYKEALAFAFLGVKRVRGEVNILRSVTGAHTDSSSGIMVGF